MTAVKAMKELGEKDDHLLLVNEHEKGYKKFTL
ncbi:hypothetical protein QFZ72_003348 [Bacillus sp. V2I10]|nr:hypothetical protein [Bacillus sp. V2I10]